MWRPLFGRVGRIGLYGTVYPIPGLVTKNTEKVRDATTVFAFSILVVTSTLSPEEVPKNRILRSTILKVSSRPKTGYFLFCKLKYLCLNVYFVPIN